jgi:hypothetical protein
MFLTCLISHKFRQKTLGLLLTRPPQVVEKRWIISMSAEIYDTMSHLPSGRLFSWLLEQPLRLHHMGEKQSGSAGTAINDWRRRISTETGDTLSRPALTVKGSSFTGTSYNQSSSTGS